MINFVKQQVIINIIVVALKRFLCSEIVIIITIGSSVTVYILTITITMYVTPCEIYTALLINSTMMMG